MNVLTEHSKITSSFFLSLGVILPWLVGLSFDYGLLGSIASFGAYLIIVSFPKIPSTNSRFLIILISICSFTLFAFVGALIKIGSIYYYLFALLFALAQAVTEIKQGYLRLPVALSTLAYFLSIEQVPAHSTPIIFGLLFFLGTLIGATVVLLFISKLSNSNHSLIPFRNDQVIGYFILITIFVLFSSFLATFLTLHTPAG